MKYHIEKNTVQETLVIPLFGRLVCSECFPQLFSDPEAKRICDSLDYDFAEKRKKMESVFGLFGALEVAQRQYDLRCEVEAYLQDHPKAAVVNLGCGLDDTFRKCDNGRCHGYNIDLPDVIAVRNELLPAGDRERNIACDLNDPRDVSAFFSLEDERELDSWSSQFASVTAKSYMRGYRDIYDHVSPLHKLMIRFCDRLVRMKIVKITFREEA